MCMHLHTPRVQMCLWASRRILYRLPVSGKAFCRHGRCSFASGAEPTCQNGDSKQAFLPPLPQNIYEGSARQLHSHLESVSKLARNVQLSYTVLVAGGVLLAFGAGYIVLNWNVLRSQVSQESAEVLSETIKDARIQTNAQEFSKALLNQLLHDDEIAKTVGAWTLRLLSDVQGDIGTLFVGILQQDQVVAEVNQLADKLVAYLCASQTIQERVGGLLVDAICLQSSRNASAEWAVELVLREDVTCGFRDLVVAALQMDAVVEEMQNLGTQVVNSVLQDPGTIIEAKKALGETLRDQDLRATAKESLWNIVSPFSGSGRTPADPRQRALRSAEDLASLDSLTPEERQMLLSLQARLKASATSKKGGGVDAAAASPPEGDTKKEPPSVVAAATEAPPKVAESPLQEARQEPIPPPQPLSEVPSPSPVLDGATDTAAARGATEPRSGGSSQEPGPVKDPLTPEELPVTKQVQLNSDKDGGDH
ncbi:unnamed protein product [Polarella glacialis]|nr:unnamed protein product [Polarella glacialis]